MLFNITQHVSHAEQELLSLPEHQCSPQVFSGVRIAQSLVFCVILLVEDQLSPFFSCFFRLFLCSPIHLFKRLIILNVTNRLTLDGNINNFYAPARIRDPL